MALRATPSRRSSVPQASKVDLADIIARLDEHLGSALLALVVNRSPRTVSRWVSEDGRLPNDFETERKIRAAFQVFQELQTVEAPPTIRAWFMGMNPQLDDRSPAEALQTGDLKDVMAAARAFTRAG